LKTTTPSGCCFSRRVLFRPPLETKTSKTCQKEDPPGREGDLRSDRDPLSLREPTKYIAFRCVSLQGPVCVRYKNQMLFNKDDKKQGNDPCHVYEFIRHTQLTNSCDTHSSRTLNYTPLHTNLNHPHHGRASPEDFLFFYKYSSWAPSQLDGELSR